MANSRKRPLVSSIPALRVLGMETVFPMSIPKTSAIRMELKPSHLPKNKAQVAIQSVRITPLVTLDRLGELKFYFLSSPV